MHMPSCIFFWGTYLIHNQLLNGGCVKKLNEKETPIQTQFLLAVRLINDPYSVLLLCWAPYNETHWVNGRSVAGLSKTTAGVCLNEVLMGRQVHVNMEQDGTGMARGEGRAAWPQSALTPVTELSANCVGVFDTGRLDPKDFIYSTVFCVVTPSVEEAGVRKTPKITLVSLCIWLNAFS